MSNQPAYNCFCVLHFVLLLVFLGLNCDLTKCDPNGLFMMDPDRRNALRRIIPKAIYISKHYTDQNISRKIKGTVHHKNDNSVIIYLP